LFQDYIRYELTVRENIGFGDIDHIDCEDRIKAVMEDLDLGFVGELDDQLGFLFDDGKQLSGGQWQKVAIARAMLSDADVYMLDEPSSSLDNINDMKIMKFFLEKSEGKIGIFITHKVRNAKFADKIIVMDEGKIIAAGEHEELLQSCELYKKLM
jgi:ATP-binding cassette subfamily C protein